MKRFKSILFLADGSTGEKAALTRAAAIATANKAKLTLFDAVETDRLVSTDPAMGSLVDALVKSRTDERRKALEALRKSLIGKRSSLRIGVDVAAGNAARSAIRAVQAQGYDLVVKAAQGGDDKPRFLFGSADRTLMRQCPCPVWILKPSKHKRFKKILAAVDVNPVDEQTESLAKLVMSLATSLAKEERAELHVLHAWRLAGETKLRGRQIYASRVDKLVDELREAHRIELEGLLKHYPYAKRTVHLLKGQADDLIPKAVAKLDVDLLVIGTVGRSGVPGLVIGNTAETVLSAVNCSVLTLKPEGF
jgi:nucleotide-binding universal stress UspA family protein